MDGVRRTKATALVAFLAGAFLVIALTPPCALAAWGEVQASIADPLGTGVVPFLNVTVANHASNDTSHVTTVEFSDDGASWYPRPYTGQAWDWVLSGDAGPKELFVRFVADDGSVSPIVTTTIKVDTSGPVTQACSARLVHRGRVAFRYIVRDADSRQVDVVLVVKGRGVVKRVGLGRVDTGRRRALLRLNLRAGAYTWHVQATDLAGREQARHAAGRFAIH